MLVIRVYLLFLCVKTLPLPCDSACLIPGFGSCEENNEAIEDRLHFSVASWFSNLAANIDTAKALNLAVYENPFFRLIINNHPGLSDLHRATQSLDMDIFLNQSIAYLRSKGEVTDALVDDTLTIRDLMKSFRTHNAEVIEAFKDMKKNANFTPEALKFADTYQQTLQAIQKIAELGPSLEDTQMFIDIEQKIIDKRTAKG